MTGLHRYCLLGPRSQLTNSFLKLSSFELANHCHYTRQVPLPVSGLNVLPFLPLYWGSRRTVSHKQRHDHCETNSWCPEGEQEEAAGPEVQAGAASRESAGMSQGRLSGSRMGFCIGSIVWTGQQGRGTYYALSLQQPPWKLGLMRNGRRSRGCLSWRRRDMISVFKYLRGCHTKEELILG